MRVLVVFVAILVGTQAVSFVELVQEQWTAFKLTHRKQYESETEEKLRMKIYMDNMHKIEVHNQRFAQGQVPYKLRINQYGDMLHQEFIHTLNGFNRTKRLMGANRDGYDGITFIAPANAELPESVDWRDKGAVTAVKDQGQCGSCWSFSATGALEGQHFRKTGDLVSLSEQNLVDCSTTHGNNGCGGGIMQYSFTYIKDNNGIDTEKSYPYEAKYGKCRFNPETVGATDLGYTDVQSGSEEQLQAAVATVGPISVAIDASHDSFQFYSDGVYDQPHCSKEDLNHAVLAVGYGTTDDGKDYWLVKNSWGTTWGDKGYIKMSRNKENQCGIATEASYPVV